MRRVFKTDSAVLLGIALVAPLSSRQHALSSWVVLGSGGKAHSASILRFAYQRKNLMCVEGALM